MAIIWKMECQNISIPFGEKYLVGLHHINIPAPRHYNIALDPPGSARDNAETVFACPHCNHVYRYTGSAAYPWHLHIPDEESGPRDPDGVCILLPCATEGCQSHIEVRTSKGADETIEQVVGRLRRSIFHVNCCSCAQLLRFPDEDGDVGLFTGSDAAPF